MAVKPQPWAYRCEQCGWRKVIAPNSDCIMDAPVEKCPSCSSENINHVKLSITESMAEKLVQIMMGRL